MWFVSGGQCTKSHRCNGRSSPSISSSASPESTRKSSWSASQWYIPIGSPGPRTMRLTPSCGKDVSSTSPQPVKGRLWPRLSRRIQRALRALRTNQPAPAGTSPASVSSSGASGITTLTLLEPHQRRQDHVRGDECCALEDERLAVAGDLPHRDRGDDERADEHRADEERQVRAERERAEHQCREEEDGDLRDRVLDDRHREV